VSPVSPVRIPDGQRARLAVRVVERPAGLLAALGGVRDRRKARGRRFELASVLALWLAGVLAGQQTFAAVWEWAADLPADLLAGFGLARGCPRSGRSAAWSRALIRPGWTRRSRVGSRRSRRRRTRPPGRGGWPSTARPQRRPLVHRDGGDEPGGGRRGGLAPRRDRRRPSTGHRWGRDRRGRGARGPARPGRCPGYGRLAPQPRAARPEDPGQGRPLAFRDQTESADRPREPDPTALEPDPGPGHDLREGPRTDRGPFAEGTDHHHARTGRLLGHETGRPAASPDPAQEDRHRGADLVRRGVLPGHERRPHPGIHDRYTTGPTTTSSRPRAR